MFDWEPIERQVDHLRYHNEDLHHWHVGVVALDATEPFFPRKIMTEEVKRLYGVPVYRLLDLPRDAIIAVSNKEVTCHVEEV